jgi:hypothetical protein
MITMMEKSDYLKGQSRRNNIIVDGTAESPHETWMESEDKVREMILEKLNLDHMKVEVECAHMTGKLTTGTGDRTRPIVVRFLRFKDKGAVLESAKNLRGTYISSIRTVLKLCARRGNKLSQP